MSYQIGLLVLLQVLVFYTWALILIGALRDGEINNETKTRRSELYLNHGQ